MKRTLISACVGVLLVSSAWAVSSSPVTHWVANEKNGGFNVQNKMNVAMKVRVELHEGEIALSTLNPNNHLKNTCMKVILQQGSRTSAVCDLSPNNTLVGDIDYAKHPPIRATGTYQISLVN